MKRARLALSIVLAAATIWVAATKFWVVPIKNPCNTFVSESAPEHTPRLERKGDEWELTISFTPAEDDESSRVYFATWLGMRTFEVFTTGRRLRASSSNGRFKIRVASEDESRQVLKELCFK
jgi:hypothetical protein